MTEHTADLRREEIARIATIIRDLPDTTTAWLRTGTVWLDAAEDLYDAGLRSQDTATARIAELEGTIDHIRGLASGEGGDEASRNDPHNALTTIVIVCDEARAILSGETRNG